MTVQQRLRNSVSRLKRPDGVDRNGGSAALIPDGGRETRAPGVAANVAALSAIRRVEEPMGGCRDGGVLIGRRDDACEHEARNAAMAWAEGRSAPKIRPDAAGRIRRRETEGASAGVVPIPSLRLGAPLSPTDLGLYESFLGSDLSRVRLHRGSLAEMLAESVRARAFTLGNNVVLGRDAERDPSTRDALLVHELVHVLQQTSPEGPFLTDREGAARREDYCSPDGACWREDEATGECIALDYTPADAVMVPEQSSSPALLLLDETDPVGNILYRLALLDVEDMVESGLLGGGENPVVVFPGLTEEPDYFGTESTGGGLFPWLGSRMAGYQSPYYYRFLAPYDPNIAQIRGGADIFPRPLEAGRTFRPAASQAEMTFRHMRPGGNVLQIGTNRISTGRNIQLLIDLATERGTGEIVRVNPSAVGTSGERFIRVQGILNDLETMERQFQEQLERARSEGRGRNYIRRLEQRLSKVGEARQYAQSFQEGHGVERIPNRAVSGVRYPRLERAMPGMIRGTGWALMAWAAWSRGQRVFEAPQEERGYQAVRQTAGFAGDLVIPVIGGSYGEYAVETLHEGPRPLSQAFPTGYTWMLDAVIGEELERADPEGARIIRNAYSSPEGAIDFWTALAGLPY